MQPYRVLQVAAVAALALAACNRNGEAPNGAYVNGSTNTALAVGSQPLPPSNEYQAVADTPPPPLPDYDQPPMPEPGYVWTPGYWDWSDSDDDYYWVPGVWIEPPGPGLYWTPGYWRYYDGRYLFSEGYWGPQVGFYGGVDYGYGYDGQGYDGGRWQGSQFYYNDQANNLGGRQFDRVYSQSVHRGGNRASYNGGPGGLRTNPGRGEIQASQAPHARPTRSQIEAVQAARAEPQLRASVNRGAPPIAATSRPAAFHGGGVTTARSAANYTPPPPRQRVGAGRTPPMANRGPPLAPSPAGREAGAPGRFTAPTSRTAPVKRAAPVERRAPNQPATPAPRAAPYERAVPAERSAPYQRVAPMAPAARYERAAPAPRTAPIERAAPVQRSAPRAAPAQSFAPVQRPTAPRPTTPAPQPRPAPAQKRNPPDHPG